MTEPTDSAPHYTPENTSNGVHACPDAACMTAGVSVADLAHIGYALNALEPILRDTASGVGTALFRDETGLNVLLTYDSPVGKAVIGAVYTPGMMARLRERGYTLTYDEAQGGVN